MTTGELPLDASALLSFRAVNSRSFRDEMELSLIGGSLSEPGIARAVRWRDRDGTVDVLPVAGIFGANSSGKTNVLRSLNDMKSIVLFSFRRGSPSGGIPRLPFRLDSESIETPTTFEIDLVVEDVRHRYGFTFDSRRVHSEWAFAFPRGRRSMIFQRTDLDVKFGTNYPAKERSAEDLLRPNALFLSTAASANSKVLMPLYGWFDRNLMLAEAESRDRRQVYTAHMLEDDGYREKVLSLLKAADLGITDARKVELDPKVQERLQRAAQTFAGDAADDDPVDVMVDIPIVQLVHQGASGPVEFDEDEESLGTLVWLGLIGPIVEALEEGSVLLTDELDASLHPFLVRQIVQLFQNPRTNPNRAQLIFNAHDLDLLGDSTDRPIGRDQVWFTEKIADGSTSLFPLSDLAPRKRESMGQRYRSGRYGGVPIVSSGDFDLFSEPWTSDHEE